MPLMASDANLATAAVRLGSKIHQQKVLPCRLEDAVCNIVKKPTLHLEVSLLSAGLPCKWFVALKASS